METLINICRWVIKSARGIFVALLVICLGVPATLYVMLSTDWAQRQLRANGEIVLEKLLGVDVEIGQVRLRPFSRLSLYDVTIHDDYGRKALSLKEVEARIELVDFILQRGLIIDYATINALDARIYRATPDSPLNIDGIIRSLTTDKPKTGANHFMMRLNTAEILNSSVSYNVYGTETTPLRFDRNHLALSEVNAVIHAPIVSTDAYGIRLRRLNFVERSGFTATDISGDFSLSNDSLLISDLTIALPQTDLEFDNIYASIDTIADVPLIGTRFPVSFGILEGSHISPSDFRAFNPRFADLDLDVYFAMKAFGTVDSLCINALTIYDHVAGLDVEARGCATNLSSPSTATLDGFVATVNADSRNVLANLDRLGIGLKPRLRQIVRNAGHVYATVELDGGIQGLDFGANIVSDLLVIQADGYLSSRNGIINYDASIDLADARLGSLLDNPDLGSLTARISSSAKINLNQLKAGRNRDWRRIVSNAEAMLDVQRFEYRGHEYSGISIEATADADAARAALTSTDADAHGGIYIEAEEAGDGLISANAHANIINLNPREIGLADKLGSNSVTAQLDADALWLSPARFNASAQITDLAFADSTGRNLAIGDLTLTADNLTSPLNSIEIESECLEGAMRGKYNLA